MEPVRSDMDLIVPHDSSASGEPAWLSQALMDKYKNKSRSDSADSTVLTSGSASNTSATQSVASGGLGSRQNSITETGDPIWLSLGFMEVNGAPKDSALDSALRSSAMGAGSLSGSKSQEQRQYKDIWSDIAAVSCASGGTSAPQAAHTAPSGKVSKWSEGSKMHAKGQCKPCAFFHDKGCETGLKCQFCHICPPREVQRRKRIRRRIVRELYAHEEAQACEADAWLHSAPHVFGGIPHFPVEALVELGLAPPAFPMPWGSGPMYTPSLSALYNGSAAF